MCGIMGYVGGRDVLSVLLKGLGSLEYRGYDSAGVAWLDSDGLKRVRCEGKLSGLEDRLRGHGVLTNSIGVGHTRWATHGEPSEANAHPHTDCTDSLVVVHNGIIENYYTLRQGLIDEGHVFRSGTDTEVVAHLIEKYLSKSHDLVVAVRRALSDVKGSYAISVMWKGSPDQLVAVRKQSPLVLGLGDGEAFLASDIPALLPYTRDLIFMEDGDMAVLSRKGIDIFSIETGERINREPQTVLWDAAMAEKAGYKHFMLKEIYEQPQAVLNTFRGRIMPEMPGIILPEISLCPELIKGLDRLVFIACGTSWHAGLVARYWIEKWVGIPVHVELASEFRYRRLILDSKVLVVPISQSGETADTLAGVRIAKAMGAPVLSICNVVGSTITRESDATIYTHAGPEIGVASTKAFTSQLAALFMLGLYIGNVRGVIHQAELGGKINAMAGLPALLEAYMAKWHRDASVIADEFYQKRDFLFLGRDLMFPIALEGALKLKEISYIHAEGYAAGEMKHGPIALIDRDMPVVALAPMDHVYEKMISNMEEVRSRRGMIIAVGEEGDDRLAQMARYVVSVPRPSDIDLTPFLYVVPLQFLAYEIAAARGCDVDQPRNLAKSVTVE